MKKILLSLTFIFTVSSVFSQTALQDGDRCFEQGDYARAIIKYGDAVTSLSGRDKQIAEIKLSRAKSCANWLSAANTAFDEGAFKVAQEHYQNVLNENPDDSYAKARMEKCSAELAAATLPRPAPRTTATTLSRAATTLTTSKRKISFPASGGVVIIDVNTDASDYEIRFLPPWCSVNKKHDKWFSINSTPNTSTTERVSYFKVYAGGQDVQIEVHQSGSKATHARNSNTTPSTVYRPSIKSCFNCPKTSATWGVTIGYAQKTINYYEMDGFQVGIKAEPLFKYGFGLNTGVLFESYSFSSHSYSDIRGDNFKHYVVNIPLHLEYRLNFSRWFNIFAYGGIGLNIIDSTHDLDGYVLPTTFEYGTGLRVGRIQFNAGKSMFLGDLKNPNDFGYYRHPYQDMVVSMSFMF